MAGLGLLTLAACTERPAPMAETAISVGATTHATALDLRGSLDEPAGEVQRPDPTETFAVPALGPDDRVASASIAQALAVKPEFDIRMGFAPGDGATALSTALADALKEAAPEGIAGRFLVQGQVAISSTDTGDTGIALTWAVQRADGAPMGEVTQTTTTSPSKIASFWGDFARSAAGPAAKGIAALVSGQTRHDGNAS